jgi:hypothetical protein
MSSVWSWSQNDNQPNESGIRTNFLNILYKYTSTDYVHFYLPDYVLWDPEFGAGDSYKKQKYINE